MTESTASPPRAVFVGSGASVFVTRTARELARRGMPVTIIDPYAGPAGGILSHLGSAGKALQQLSRTRRLLKTVTGDVPVVVHNLPIHVAWLSWLLKRRFSRVIGLAYGSDILRRDASRDWLLRKGLGRFDCLAATSPRVMTAMISAFPELAGREQVVIRFGLPVFDALDQAKSEGIDTQQARKRLGFDPDLPLISLGYAASAGQRQQELIEYFADHDLTDLQFVVPVQYGSPEVQAHIVELCARVNQGRTRPVFRALTEFHEPKTAALMRIATLVLINNSISDSFSGTVQEVIYAGNLVLAAAHLPYDRMPGFGSSIRAFADLAECRSAVSADALQGWRSDADACYGRVRDELRQTSSWDGVFPDWVALLSGRERSVRLPR